jgi:hypothetical protein
MYLKDAENEVKNYCILKSDRLSGMLYKTFTEYIKLMNQRKEGKM